MWIKKGAISFCEGKSKHEKYKRIIQLLFHYFTVVLLGLICYAFHRTYFFWRKKSKQKNIDKINSLACPCSILHLFSDFPFGLLSSNSILSVWYFCLPFGVRTSTIQSLNKILNLPTLICWTTINS